MHADEKQRERAQYCVPSVGVIREILTAYPDDRARPDVYTAIDSWLNACANERAAIAVADHAQRVAEAACRAAHPQFDAIELAMKASCDPWYMAAHEKKEAAMGEAIAAGDELADAVGYGHINWGEQDA
jgi:hypothetical protein